jgi:tetratricopeptide (TPR) repeat protein
MAPNDADVANLYADFMMQVGDFKAAERLERKAIELDPLAAVHYSDITYVMFTQHRYEEGLEFGRVSESLEPGDPSRADPKIAGLIANGYYTEAIQEIKLFEPNSDSYRFLVDWWWCLLYFQQDDEQRLREKLDSIIETLGTDVAHMDYTLVAFFTAWLDGTDEALPFLSKAYETNEYNLFWPEYFYLPEQISDDPDWLAFWQQPRLAGLIEMRRANQTRERIGWWKERSVQ